VSWVATRPHQLAIAAAADGWLHPAVAFFAHMSTARAPACCYSNATAAITDEGELFTFGCARDRRLGHPTAIDIPNQVSEAQRPAVPLASRVWELLQFIPSPFPLATRLGTVSDPRMCLAWSKACGGRRLLTSRWASSTCSPCWLTGRCGALARCACAGSFLVFDATASAHLTRLKVYHAHLPHICLRTLITVFTRILRPVHAATRLDLPVGIAVDAL
jgi:hypothetical protein